MAEEIKVRVLNAPKAKTLSSESAVSDKKRTAARENRRSDTKRQAILLSIKVAFFALICYLVLFVIFGVSRMSDYSMYPSVRDGDLLVYYRLENNYNNGDVVVVNMHGEEVVMRIIASGGQKLDISEEGGLLVDGQSPTYQAFYETHRADSYPFSYPYIVSPNCYFMLNDYRSNVNDSRTFGEVCREKIKGRLITKIQVRDL